MAINERDLELGMADLDDERDDDEDAAYAEAAFKRRQKVQRPVPSAVSRAAPAGPAPGTPDDPFISDEEVSKLTGKSRTWSHQTGNQGRIVKKSDGKRTLFLRSSVLAEVERVKQRSIVAKARLAAMEERMATRAAAAGKPAVKAPKVKPGKKKLKRALSLPKEPKAPAALVVKTAAFSPVDLAKELDKLHSVPLGPILGTCEHVEKLRGFSDEMAGLGKQTRLLYDLYEKGSLRVGVALAAVKEIVLVIDSLAERLFKDLR